MRDGKPLMSFAVMGGSMQAQSHVQVTTRIADHGQNPQAASDAPRWRVMDASPIFNLVILQRLLYCALTSRSSNCLRRNLDKSSLWGVQSGNALILGIPVTKYYKQGLSQ